MKMQAKEYRIKHYGNGKNIIGEYDLWAYSEQDAKSMFMYNTGFGEEHIISVLVI